MKITIATLSILVMLSLIPMAAGQESQEASVESPKIEAEAARDREQRLKQEERTKALLEKKTAVYSGFVVDVSRAERKSRLFSLRTPRDPKSDYKNISLDERTERPRGFVLSASNFKVFSKQTSSAQDQRQRPLVGDNCRFRSR